jgi:hypothetical protein
VNARTSRPRQSETKDTTEVGSEEPLADPQRRANGALWRGLDVGTSIRSRDLYRASEPYLLAGAASPPICWPARPRRTSPKPPEGKARPCFLEETMDEPEKKGPADHSKINMSEPWEVDYWTEELGVSAGELRRLVAKVGTSADAVRKELGMLGKAH